MSTSLRDILFKPRNVIITPEPQNPHLNNQVFSSIQVLWVSTNNASTSWFVMCLEISVTGCCFTSGCFYYVPTMIGCVFHDNSIIILVICGWDGSDDWLYSHGHVCANRNRDPFYDKQKFTIHTCISIVMFDFHSPEKKNNICTRVIGHLIEAEWRKYASVNRPSLVQLMACRLVGAKPLSEPLPEYCQLEP